MLKSMLRVVIVWFMFSIVCWSHMCVLFILMNMVDW